MWWAGTGAFKLAANYAPGVVAQKSAAKAGYVQNLWLHGPEHRLTEVGTMNLFVVFKGEDGGKWPCLFSMSVARRPWSF